MTKRERKRELVCVCVCVYLCETERERVRVCVSERARERESVCERERESLRERERETERERESVCDTERGGRGWGKGTSQYYCVNHLSSRRSDGGLTMQMSFLKDKANTRAGAQGDTPEVVGRYRSIIRIYTL